MDPPFTRCNGIMYHEDSVWQLCAKYRECQRYISRHDPALGPVVNKLCQTVEFEHWVKVDA